MSDNQTFNDILAGVKRMRDDVGGETDNSQSAKPQYDSSPLSVVPDAPQSTEKPRLITRKLPATTLIKETTPESNIPRSNRVKMTPGLSEILVSKSQKGNPLLSENAMKGVAWRYDGEVVCDYYISRSFQILFLSLKYHKIRPEYIWTRLKKLFGGATKIGDTSNNDSTLRVLLCVVDIDSPQDVLRQLNDFCVKNELSLVLAWSFEEAANYIAMAKQLAMVPARAHANIMPPRTRSYLESITDTLTTVPSVNKTDVKTLLANYGSFKQVVLATGDPDSQLEDVPGFGPTKAARLRQWFNEPFIYNQQ